MQIINKIEHAGIVPVVVIENAKDAKGLGKALYSGGLRVVEITFRTSAAEESIRVISEYLPDMLVGAGTILSIEQAKMAVSAGAKFLVTPGYNEAVVCWCVKENIPIIPGCPTTTDIEAALLHGLRVLKFFPAEAMGGMASIQALLAPYPTVRFMPTGGISQDNLTSYLKSPKVIAAGGSWMVRKEWIEAGEFDRIEQATKQAVHKMLGFQVAHIGINCSNETEAKSTAQLLCDLFGWEIKEGGSSVFAGERIEAVKQNGRGKHGHIAIATNSIKRAAHFLQEKGIEIDETSLVEKDGRLAAVYLQQQINGFAIHLLQKQ